MNKKILIVEDEPGIADNIRLALQREGMASITSHLGGEVSQILEREEVDLVTLDIGLPDMTGIEVCRQIRKVSEVPVIFLTARDGEIDKILGLELGADDYLAKPFNPRELVARIKAVLRRSKGSSKGGTNSVLEGDHPVTVDKERKLVLIQSVELDLTPHEFGIVETLSRYPGKVCSRGYLLDQVWHEQLNVSDRVIDTHVKSIRSKITDLQQSGKITGHSSYIRTHRGFGYSLAEG